MTLAAIEESKQFVGTLTLGSTSFEKQATEVSLVPSVEAGTTTDAVEVLSGQKLAATEENESYTWALNLGLIQDFIDSAGLVEYLRANAGTEKAFEWVPNVAGPTYAGNVRIRPTTIGGPIRVRLTSTVELPIVGDYTATYPTPEE